MSDGNSSSENARKGTDPAVRPLPPTKTLAESIRRGATKTAADRIGSQLSEDEAFKLLESYAAKVHERHQKLEELFKGFAVDPLENPDYKKFLSDQLATAAMYFAATGRLPQAMSELSEDIAAAMGFNTADGEPDVPTGLDPSLASNPAALAAMEAGFDPTDDSMDDVDMGGGGYE